MPEIVLGVGTSHSPLLAISPELWIDRGSDDLKRTDLVLADGRVVTYGQKLAEADTKFAGDATLEHFRGQAARAQGALDHLSNAIAQASPDVVVIVGDDQEELFRRAYMPAVAIYTGDTVHMHPRNEVQPNLPQWYKDANVGYQMDAPTSHSGSATLARLIVEGWIERGVDVSVASSVHDPRAAGFGHAYGFVFGRLLQGKDTPCIPILLNTYYPPNVPTPPRCYEIGRKLRETIESIPDQGRIAIIASGGLTHFATDEQFDRKVMTALAERDEDLISKLPVRALRSGNSEILNWLLAGGALEHLQLKWSDYIPVHRTPAGTGIGLGFALWSESAS